MFTVTYNAIKDKHSDEFVFDLGNNKISIFIDIVDKHINKEDSKHIFDDENSTGNCELYKKSDKEYVLISRDSDIFYGYNMVLTKEQRDNFLDVYIDCQK